MYFSETLGILPLSQGSKWTQEEGGKDTQKIVSRAVWPWKGTT